MTLSKNSVIAWSSLLLIAAGSTGAFAVEPGQISTTAKITAVYRAIGARDRDVKFRNGDMFAEKFFPLDTWSEIFPRYNFGNDAEQAARRIKANPRCGFYYVNARTKHIDSILSESIRHGVAQVVNLGAGYDSRAYRFHDAAPRIRYYEVDLPEMIADKKKRVIAVLGTLPQWVTYVPVNFGKQTLETELKRAGYDRTLKTFFILEGVTMYISKEAVDATLLFIAGNSQPGSSIVFDYTFRSVIDFVHERGLTKRGSGSFGEPIIFGINEGEVGGFLRERGLVLIEDISAVEIAHKYLALSDGRLDGYLRPRGKIAHAVVADRARW